ncbi:MAG: hypothetical protein AMJ69_10635 [Gammaproteobacteria bacterium SG8_47]|nr:MAG: hypothetical protein AMJ69_10635 [Gammaproteobacteria bacterium SG8_47]
MTAPLPWLQTQWGQVSRQMEQGRLPHALLLTGPTGVGKLTLARALTRSLLCEQRSDEGAACGECRGCRLMAAGTHPDTVEISPEEDSKVIKIDQIRTLSSYLSLTTQYGGAKVALVHPADALNVNAANSLLKTLEEPAAHAVLILCTSRPASLPATVRSRCQTLRVGIPPADVAAQWLAPQLQSGEFSAEQLLALASGAPLAAAALVGSDSLACRRRVVEGLAAVVTGRQDPVSVSSEWLKAGAELPLYWLYSVTTDIIRLRSSPEHGASVANADLMATLQRIGERVNLRELFARHDQLTAALRAARGQANPQLLLEDLLIGWTPST